MSLLPILVALALLSPPADTLPVSQPRSDVAIGPSEPRFADVQLATGVRLRYAELGDSSAPPMILLHGYTDSWFSYSRVLPLLAARHHVFALDQRGHGDSDRPTRGYALDDFAADVVAFMDARGIRRAVVVGHSLGSVVAQHVVRAAPERVTRLVLVGSTTQLRNPAVLELEQAVRALSDPVPSAFARDFQASTVHRPIPDAFMARVVSESLKLPARTWQQVMTGMLTAQPLAHAPARAPRVPTLVVWGDRDAIFPRSEQQALIRLLPPATLTVYAGTGHAPHWEEPERFARDVLQFTSGPR
jgi:pimeloyl-ACP methyl ester carboxylesterase